MGEPNFLSFLEIALEDLDASKILSNNKLYPQSIFYLQQAIEKTTKYLGLKNNTIEQKELMKDISHKASKIFKKEVLKHKEFTPFVNENDIHNEFAKISDMILKEEMDNLLPFLVSEIDKADSKTVNDYELLDIDSLEKLTGFLIKSNQFNKEDLDDFIKTLENPVIYNIVQKKLKDTINQGFLMNTAKYANSAFILFLLTCLFEKVFPEIRYPSQIDLKRPSLVFNENNILIKNLKYFQDQTYKCIQVIMHDSSEVIL